MILCRFSQYAVYREEARSPQKQQFPATHGVVDLQCLRQVSGICFRRLFGGLSRFPSFS